MSMLADIARWLLRVVAGPETPPRKSKGAAGIIEKQKATHFLSNRSQQKQIELLEELLVRCEIFSAEQRQARVYVQDQNWSAVVAISVVTGMNSLADAKALNGSPHQWPEIQARCVRHLKNRQSNLQKKPKAEKNIRFLGGRSRIVPGQDPSGHVTDITD